MQFSQENIDRAGHVEGALAAYADEHDAGADPGETLVDFLTDLKHWAVQHDINWDTLEASSEMHWLAEMSGE